MSLVYSIGSNDKGVIQDFRKLLELHVSQEFGKIPIIPTDELSEYRNSPNYLKDEKLIILQPRKDGVINAMFALTYGPKEGECGEIKEKMDKVLEKLPQEIRKKCENTGIVMSEWT